jgi:hypothetical protein
MEYFIKIAFCIGSNLNMSLYELTNNQRKHFGLFQLARWKMAFRR